MSLLETIGGLLIALVVIGGAAYGLYTAFSKNNIANTEQALVTMRMQTQQFFFGTAYDNLDNAVAMTAGIVPEALIKNSAMRNAWGGDVTLSSSSADGTFSIELTKIPQDACVQLARFQPDAWEGIAINGGDVDTSDMTAITGACQDGDNSVMFTAR